MLNRYAGCLRIPQSDPLFAVVNSRTIGVISIKYASYATQLSST